MPLISIVGPGSRLYVAGGDPPSGDEFSGFTISHYVAPFASVSGATSDDDDMGATAWTNSSNIATPTTIGTALRRAVAGNNVGAFEGLYTRTATQAGTSGNPTLPTFNFTNSGSSHSSPIRLIGRYKPTRADVDPSDYSQFSNGVTSGTSGFVTIGSNGRDYVHWHNSYVYEDISRTRMEVGLATLSGTGSVGGRLIGCRLKGINTSDHDTGSNHSALWFNEGSDMFAENCIIEDMLAPGGNDNVAGWHMFTTRNSGVRHCEVRNSVAIAYVKYNHGSAAGMYGIVIEYNKFSGMTSHGIRMGDPSTDGSTRNAVRHNLFTDIASGGGGGAALVTDYANNNANGPGCWDIYNNTAYNCQRFHFQGGVRDNALFNSQEYNNLFSTGEAFFYSEEGDARVTGQYAAGYRAGYNGTRSVTNWGRTTGGTRATPAAWNTAFGLDATSVQLGSDPFVNAAGGDFHLSPGHAARTTGNTGGAAGGGSACPVGCYITGSEEIGLEADYQ